MPKLSTFLVALAVLTAAAALTAPVYAILDEDEAETASNPDLDSAVRAIKKEDYRSAIGHLARVLAEEPKNANALNYLCYSHRKLGDFRNAIAHQQRKRIPEWLRLKLPSSSAFTRTDRKSVV